MAATGELTKKFFGEETTYDLDPESKQVMEALTVVQTLYTLGTLPSETGALIRNIKKIADKKKESKSEGDREKSRKSERKDRKKSRKSSR